MFRAHVSLRALAGATALALAVLGSSQSSKPTIPPEVVKRWENLGQVQISQDGRWITAQISRVDADGQLEIRNCDTPSRWAVPNGGGAQFSDDSKWVAYTIRPPLAEARRLAEERKPVPVKLGYRNLESGQETVIDGVASFFFLKGSRALVVQRTRPATRQTGGSDLTVIDLQEGTDLTLGNVAASVASPDGKLLAVELESEGGQRGVQVLDPETGVLRTVVSGPEAVEALTWAGNAPVLGFLRGAENPAKEGPFYRVVLATDLRAVKPNLRELSPMQVEAFPKDHRVVEFAGLTLNRAGTVAAFGVAPWAAKRKPPEGRPEERPGVEVWNTMDVSPIPRQKRTAEGDRRANRAFVYRFDESKLIEVERSPLESVSWVADLRYAIVNDPTPHEKAVNDGTNMVDVSLVNLQTGERTLIRQGAMSATFGSRTGKYVAYWSGEAWWLMETATGNRRNLTGKLGVRFDDEWDDGTTRQRPAARSIEFLAGDAGWLVYDFYDVWLFRDDGGAPRRLTNGRKDGFSYRRLNLRPSPDGAKITDPMHFAIWNRATMAEGLAMANPDEVARHLVVDNLKFLQWQWAMNADRLVFTLQSAERSPGAFVTNPRFEQAKPVLETNPQQKDYAMSKAQLVSYRSRWGLPLTGALHFPANHRPGVRYPMVIYIYERVSDDLHTYQIPFPNSAYNVAALTQAGYFVYQADIAYRPRNPGISAVECLDPALDAALKLNVGIDPSRVGLMGHSWGAYQTAFVTSVSKRFAVGVCGAPLTELTSMYNSYYWNSGTPNQELLETGQGRMQVPFWEDMESYLKNSPVHRARERQVPLLVAFGDQDGAVDWHQGQQMYNTLRRLGKPMVLLVYAGENHGLARRANQLDYARRLRHYLDVYLKGTKPEPWVQDGVPFLKQTGG